MSLAAVAFTETATAQQGLGKAVELKRLRDGYDAAVQRTTKPLADTYLAELRKLKASYTKDGRQEEAQQVETEMQMITAKLESMGAPPSTFAVVPAGQTIVMDVKAMIPANSPDGFKVGPVRKGDVISLQYIEGKWKDHGVIASANPDDAKDDPVNRLVISQPSKSGAPGNVLAAVPPGTAAQPFTYAVQTSRDMVVLRISENSNNPKNPGSVYYQLRITR
jgi:hypothetical protein